MSYPESFSKNLSVTGLKSVSFNGPPDKYGYCAYDLESAQKTLTWFVITKVISGGYPLWANQLDIWKPHIKKGYDEYFFSLCFAFGLAENRCIVTKFEMDNPVKGAPEIFIDNPLSTNNLESFWNVVLKPTIVKSNTITYDLIEAIEDLYKFWHKTYCQDIISNMGLRNEHYFKYFNYNDFLTPNSGLIQIRKFAEVNGKPDLLARFDDITGKTKKVREEIYRLLVEEFNYFA